MGVQGKLIQSNWLVQVLVCSQICPDKKKKKMLLTDVQELARDKVWHIVLEHACTCH